MRSTASPERALGPLAACGLEAGWITLVYLLADAMWAHGSAPLPEVAFACAALLGIGSARWAAGRSAGPVYEAMLAALAIGLAIAGWLIPFGPPTADVLRDPLSLVRAHPAGFLLGVAFVRGTAHVSAEADERIADLALGPGLAAIAVAWLLLVTSDLTTQPATVAVAFVATVTFMAAGLLSLGLARLAALRGHGVAGGDRRMWLHLLVGIVCSLVAVAVPLGAVAGVPLDVAARSAAGPLWGVVIAVALVLVWPAALIVGALSFVLDLVHGVVGFVPTFRPSPGLPELALPYDPSSASASVDPSILVILVPIAALAVVLVLMRLLRRPPLITVEGGVVEVHEIERPAGVIRLPRLRARRARRHADPDSASEAYIASLELLAREPSLARRVSETPAEHARRIGAGPLLPIRRLAADYALAEFGRRALSAAEHRRAVARWRSIGRSIER